MQKMGTGVKILLPVLFISILVVNLSTSFVKTFDNETFGRIDHEATAYIDLSLKKSLLAFGVAKALNSAVSFFQETTLAVQPLGLGVELPVGQVLDPLNDMIERASWVFLASATSLGIQRLFIGISQWAVLSVLLNFFLICTLLSFFIRTIGFDLRLLAIRIGIVLLFVRCFIPVSYLINAHIYEQFMQDTYSDQIGILEKHQTQMDHLSKTTRSHITDKKKIMAVFKEIASVAKDISGRLLKLITIFITQVIVMPLLFLWLFMQGVRQIFTFRGELKFELK